MEQTPCVNFFCDPPAGSMQHRYEGCFSARHPRLPAVVYMECVATTRQCGPWRVHLHLILMILPADCGWITAHPEVEILLPLTSTQL